jgi:hypothetical protein
MFKYADIVLSLKHKHERRVALNLIGGEPFFHPDIVEILEYINSEYKSKYQDKWKLSVAVTSNGLIGDRALARALDLIDYWAISYHTESLPKQKDLTISTIQKLHSHTKNLEVMVMAPSDIEKFTEASSVHSVFLGQGIHSLLKPLHKTQYSTDQTNTFKVFWKTKNKEQITNYTTSSGITCCSNRPLVLNGDNKNLINFIPSNNFRDWHCTINLNFLHVDHLRNVYHNSGCLVSSLTGKIEPIGTISEYEKILDTLSNQVMQKSVPVIKCPRDVCYGCGMCATKARSQDDLTDLMRTHLMDVSVLKFNTTDIDP